MVIVNKDLPQENDEFKIIIQYTEDVYQNIENSKGTSFETFFSGVGGFVGIFCGYSIMQIPETLENVEIRTTFKKMMENLGDVMAKISGFFCLPFWIWYKEG